MIWRLRPRDCLLCDRCRQLITASSLLHHYASSAFASSAFASSAFASSKRSRIRYRSLLTPQNDVLPVLASDLKKQPPSHMTERLKYLSFD